MAEARNVLFGRQRRRPLSARRRRFMAEFFPALRIATDVDAPADLAALFDVEIERVIVEIGFGAGEHLIAGASADLSVGYIGVEPFVSGLAKAVSEIDRLGLRNTRLFDDDAGLLLDWLPPASIHGIDLLYPDPWPKRRHRKRRFVSAENIARAARVLVPGTEFRVATDIPSYSEWTRSAFGKHDGFVLLGGEADNRHRPFAGWSGTRYEAKALLAGRRPVYLRFRRV